LAVREENGFGVSKLAEEMFGTEMEVVRRECEILQNEEPYISRTRSLIILE